MARKSIVWKTCCVAVVALSALAFSPLVLSPGVHTPELFGLPRTLWLGILIAFLLVGVTYIGGAVHAENDRESQPARDDEC